MTTHVIVAVALAVTALIAFVVLRDSPAFHPNTGRCCQSCWQRPNFA